jgi:DNA mismatch endonuclease (patch repair protein)
VAVIPRSRGGRQAKLRVDEATSTRLGRIRQSGTGAELAVRKMVSSLGGRYRTKNRDLPGSPDIANRSRMWAIFVHGCYWHAHLNCSRATVPKRNRLFWEAKFSANRTRDARAIRELRSHGFRVVVVWECEIDKHPKLVLRRLNDLVQLPLSR